ncbi:MAG TPA: hypothetical protein VIV11_27460 [Kofleriaceae bacterium]
MRVVVGVVLTCVGCLSGGQPRVHHWRHVEPAAIQRGERATLFVITRESALVIDAVVIGEKLHGNPSSVWRTTPGQRIVVRGEESPADTAARHGWPAAPLGGTIAIPREQVLHASKRTSDLAGRTLFVTGSIALLLAVIVGVGGSR